MTTTKTRRGLSLLAAFAVASGALALPAATSATQAAPAFGLVAAAPAVPSVVDLDPTKTGSITIHKYVKDDTNGITEGNGKTQAVTGTPLGGVTFQVERLTSVDLTTAAGWEKLAAYNGNVDNAKADGVGTAQSLPTGSNGEATFSNLPLGAYVVTETVTPAGYVGSKPFIITVPMTDPDSRDTWMYDVHAYPKNSKAGIEKTVNDANTPAIGSPISYTLKSDIPDVAALDYYDVLDQYDSRVTLPQSGITLKITGGKSGDTNLVAGTDYTLVEGAEKAVTGSTTLKTKMWTAQFTAAGRAKLIAERKDNDTKVQMDLAGTVTGKVESDGLFQNKGVLLPSNPGNGWNPADGEVPPPPTPTDDWPHSEVVSKFGKLRITKVNANNTGQTLQGAEFEVYKCTPSGTPTQFGQNNATLDTKLSPAGTTTFVTGADGTVTIDGLRNNDWENNAEVPQAQRGWYCLVETKAPDGFELQTQPITFQILQSNATAGNTYTLDTTVKDVPHNGGFNLPLTGAAGVGFLIGAGALLVAGSGALAYANKRRKDQVQA